MQGPKQPVPIKDLFASYRVRLRAPESSVVRAAAVVMSDIAPLPVEESMLSYTVATRTLAISAPSLLKQRLLIAAPEILARLETELGPQSCPRALV